MAEKRVPKRRSAVSATCSGAATDGREKAPAARCVPRRAGGGVRTGPATRTVATSLPAPASTDRDQVDDVPGLISATGTLIVPTPKIRIPSPRRQQPRYQGSLASCPIHPVRLRPSRPQVPGAGRTPKGPCARRAAVLTSGQGRQSRVRSSGRMQGTTLRLRGRENPCRWRGTVPCRTVHARGLRVVVAAKSFALSRARPLRPSRPPYREVLLLVRRMPFPSRPRARSAW
jgi:hypothetical protein